MQMCDQLFYMFRCVWMNSRQDKILKRGYSVVERVAEAS